MRNAEPIYLETGKKASSKVRILTPAEYNAFVGVIPDRELRTIFETCFWTAARYVEVQRLYENPSWYKPQRGAIYLPKEADAKVKRVAPGRYISPLPDLLSHVLPYFFDGKKPPASKVWNADLKRWAVLSGICLTHVPAAEIDEYLKNKRNNLIVDLKLQNGIYEFHDLTGIVPKMTRKTLESWMVAVNISLPIICNRQGHDALTSLNHYQAVPFTEDEKRTIRHKLSGWAITD
jgi:hypothetical protein